LSGCDVVRRREEAREREREREREEEKVVSETLPALGVCAHNKPRTNDLAGSEQVSVDNSDESAKVNKER
jgi:hypothetical protein